MERFTRLSVIVSQNNYWKFLGLPRFHLDWTSAVAREVDDVTTVLLQGVHCISVSATVTPNPTSQNPECPWECVQWGFWFSDWWTLHFSSADRTSKLSDQSHTLSSGLNRLSYLFIHFSVYSLHSSSWWSCLKIPWPLCTIQEMKGINSQRSQISILMITGNVNLSRSHQYETWQDKSLSKPAMFQLSGTRSIRAVPACSVWNYLSLTNDWEEVMNFLLRMASTYLHPVLLSPVCVVLLMGFYWLNTSLPPGQSIHIELPLPERLCVLLQGQ